MSLTVLKGIRENQQRQYEELLAQQSKTINLLIRQQYLMANQTTPEQFILDRAGYLATNSGALVGLPVKIYDRQGKERGTSLTYANPTEVGDALSFALTGKLAYFIVEDTLYYLAPIYLADQQVGVMQLQYSLTSQSQFYTAIKQLFIVIGVLTFLLSFIVGYLYFNSVTDAIQRLKAAVDSIRKGHYDNIPSLARKDELGDLNQGISYMAEQIEQNIEAMQEFIGNIGHEFKTPLTSIKAYADLMEMYPDDAKLISEATQSINKESLRLAQMVEKTLLLASLENYDFVYDSRPVQLKPLLEDVCGRMGGKIQKFGLKLEQNLVDAEVWADPEILMQIFINLLDNAIKYNRPEGWISIKSSIVEGKVRVEVYNTGLRIPPEARDKIYQPFYTVNKDRSRQSGGTGLGLTLVKKLVEQQGGTVDLVDEHQEGTAFWIRFPLYTDN